MKNKELIEQLFWVEKVAEASKLSRMLRQPFKYIFAIFYQRLIYPKTRRGITKKVITFFNVPMTVVLPASTDIYLTSGKSHPSEIRLARFMIQKLSKGDTFLDIGAHFGYFSLLASVLVEVSGKILSFEASKSTVHFLRRNSALFSNIQVFHTAVSDYNEKVSFYEFPVYYSEYNSMDIDQFKDEKWFAKFKPEKIEVEAMTIDQIVFINNIHPTLIKIDVEGGEYKVIAGAKNTLKNYSPYLVMEYLSANRHNTPHRDALKLLKSFGYHPSIINRDGSLSSCANIESYLIEQNLDSDNIVFQKQNFNI